MKSFRSILWVILLLAPFACLQAQDSGSKKNKSKSAKNAPVVAQPEAPKNDITVFDSVLKTAEWASFKYVPTLDLAKTGDVKALKSLFEFSGTVDGVEAILHATTCLELIPFATDEMVAPVISSLKPKLQAAMLERLTLAQGRTQKEALRKPLQEWAPLCWRALHGEKIRCTSCAHEGLQMAPGANVTKPGMVKPTPAATASPTDKQ